MNISTVAPLPWNPAFYAGKPSPQHVRECIVVDGKRYCREEQEQGSIWVFFAFIGIVITVIIVVFWIASFFMDRHYGFKKTGKEG